MQIIRERKEIEDAQCVVQRLVNASGQFDGANVSDYLDKYNNGMLQEDVGELTKLKYLSRVVSLVIHTQIKELQEAQTSWDIFQITLLKRVEDEDVTCASLHEFEKQVVLKKPYKSALASFRQFGRQFARLSNQDRRLGGGGQSANVLKVCRSN